MTSKGRHFFCTNGPWPRRTFIAAGVSELQGVLSSLKDHGNMLFFAPEEKRPPCPYLYEGRGGKVKRIWKKAFKIAQIQKGPKMLAPTNSRQNSMNGQ